MPPPHWSTIDGAPVIESNIGRYERIAVISVSIESWPIFTNFMILILPRVYNCACSIKIMSGRKCSPIWKFFSVSITHSRYAKCSTCGNPVSRGGQNTKSYNTTNLVRHLEKKHPKKHANYFKLVEDEEAGGVKKGKQPVLRQLLFEESRERSAAWSINDTRAQVVHKWIGEMIALDFWPFAIIEDKGCLLNTLEPRYAIPSRRYPFCRKYSLELKMK